MPAFQLCADFTVFPITTSTLMPTPHVTLASYDFDQLGGAQWFVNDTSGEVGLHFPPQGMEITLPVPVRTVR